MEVARLLTYLEAKTDQHDRAIDASGKKVQDFVEGASKSGDKGGSLFSKMVSGAKDFGLAMSGVKQSFDLVGGAFGGLIGPAADFDQQMASIRATAGATGPELGQLKQLALDLGQATDVGSVSASDAASAIFELGKAGVSVSDTMGGAAKATLQMAAAAGPEFGVANAASLAADAMNTFSSEGLSAAQVANTLVGAANASSIGLSDLKMSLSAVGSVATGIGMSFKDVNTTLAVFGMNGIKGSDAGTSLKTMLANLQPRTTAAKDEFMKFGLILKDGTNAFIGSNGKIKDAATVAGILQHALGGLTDAQRQQTLYTMFGSDAIRAGNIFVKEGTEGFNKMAEAELKQGNAAQVAGDMSNNMRGKMEALKGTIETIQIKIGDALIPTVSKLADKFNNWLGSSAVSTGIAALGEGLSNLLIALLPIGDIVINLASVALPVLSAALQVAAGAITFVSQHFTELSIAAAVIVPIIYAELIPAFVAWGVSTAAAAVATVVAFAPVIATVAAVVAAALALKAAWDWATSLFKSDTEKMADAAKAAADRITVDMKAAAAEIASSLTTGIAKGVTDIANLVKSATQPTIKLGVDAPSGAELRAAIDGINPPSINVPLEAGEVSALQDAVDTVVKNLKTPAVSVALDYAPGAVPLSLKDDIQKELDKITPRPKLLIEAGLQQIDPKVLALAVGVDPVTGKSSTKVVLDTVLGPLTAEDYNTAVSQFQQKFGGQERLASGLQPINLPAQIQLTFNAALWEAGKDGSIFSNAEIAKMRTAVQEAVTKSGPLNIEQALEIVYKVHSDLTAPSYGGGGASNKDQHPGGSLVDHLKAYVLAQVANMPPVEVTVPITVTPELPSGKGPGMNMPLIPGVNAPPVGGADTSGAVQAARDAQTQINGIISGINTSLNTLKTNVAQAASQAMSLFRTGIAAGGAAVTVTAAQVAGTTVSAFRNGFSSAALASIALVGMSGFSAGVHTGGAIAAVQGSVATAQVRGAVAAGMAPGQYVALGRFVGSGLAIGIASSTGAAVAAARNMASQVIAAAKTGLGTHSPSRPMIDSGTDVTAGLAIGINDTRHRATEAASAMGKSVNVAAAAGLANNSAPLAAVEASINQVMALAKRVVSKNSKDLMEAFSSITSAVGGTFDLSQKLGSKDYLAPTRAAMDSFFVSAEYIVTRSSALITKYKGLFTKTQADLAGFASQVVGAFSGVVDVVAKLGTKDLTLPTDAILKGFFASVDTFLKSADKLILGWSGHWDQTRAELAGFMGSVVESLGKAVSTLQALSSKDFSIPTKSVLDSFFYGVDSFLKAADKLVLGWTNIWSSTRVELAGFIGSVVEGLGKAIGTLQALSSKDLAIASLDQIKLFLSGVDRFLKEADKLVLGWTNIWDSTRTTLAGFLGSVVDGIGKAYSTLKSLADTNFAVPTDGALILFFDGVGRFLTQADTLVAEWGTKWDDTRTKLAGFIGSVVDGLGKAFAPLKALAGMDFAVPTDAALILLFDAIGRFLKGADTLVSTWTDRWDQTRVNLSAFMASVVDGLGKTLGTLENLSDLKFAVPTDAALILFFDGIGRFLTQADVLLGQWKGRWDKTHTDLSGFIGSIVDGLGKTLGTLENLADLKFAVPTDAALILFFDGINRFLKQADVLLGQWKGKWDKTSADLAVFVGSIVDGISKSFDGLTKLSTLKAVPFDTQLILFFDAVNRFLIDFASYSAAWATKANNDAVDIAKNVSSVVASIGSVVDPLVKLMKWETPGLKDVFVRGADIWKSGDGMADFFLSLDRFLDTFAERAKAWSGKATKTTAEIAGYIGTIGTEIGKLVDPLLKIISFQMPGMEKATDIFVRGNGANLFFDGITGFFDNVDRVLNEVIKRYSGANLSQATEVATQLGTLFTQLGTAFGVVNSTVSSSSGGFGQFLTDLKTIWATVFGPATQEGTLLYQIFGKPHGMFNWMDQNVPIYMGFSAGVWKTALLALQQQISETLAEMKIALANDAYEVGQAIKQGIADGLGGNTPGGNGTPPSSQQGPTPSGGNQGFGYTPAYNYVPQNTGGGSGKGDKHYHGPVTIINGMEVTDPDLHRLLANIKTKQGMES